MAITYHAGRRIQGLAPLSADTTGTQVTASNGVVSFDITTRTTNQAVTYDIGSNLSDSAWVMRAKLDYVAITGGSGSTAYLELGVGSASSSTAFANGGITQDFIGLQQRKASDADGWGLVGYNSTGTLDNPESPLMDAVPNTSTTYYVEIKRLTSTSMSIGLYTTSSYGTLISGIALETKTNVPSGVTGLRYIRVGNAGMISETAGNVIEGTVTDVEIWDGVTTASGDSTYQVHDPKPTNVQVGSRYEETDTRKMYHYNPVTFEDDFSSSPNGWTLNAYGSGQSIASGKLISSSSPSNGYKAFAIGSPTDITLDLDWEANGSFGTAFVIISSDYSGTNTNGGYGDPPSGHKRIILMTPWSNGNIYFSSRYNNGGATENNGTIVGSTGASSGTKYFYRFVKSGTSLSFKRYLTDANRTAGTSLQQEATATMTSTNVTDYNATADYAYINVGAYSSNGTNSLYNFKLPTTGNAWSEEGT